MDFEDRLNKAIQRGQQQNDARQKAKTAGALSEDDLKRLHGQYQFKLSEHIEACLTKVAQHFLGFQFETVVNDRGWGAAVSRDDFGRAAAGSRANLYSRLEMTIRPFGSHHVLELAAKGTIRNKEIFNRSHYQLLTEADPDRFSELVDTWALEYAELYAARQ